MRIGVDGSRIVTGVPTGTENYSRQLTAALLRAGSPHRFLIYTRGQVLGDSLPSMDNYEVRAMPFPRLWTHVRLSAEMSLHPPDALLVPAHVLPPIHPRNSLVTVHDLGYRYFPKAHRSLDRLYLDLSTRWNARAASIVLADSQVTRADLAQIYGIPERKICVVYPALNEGWGEIRVRQDEIDRVRAYYGLGLEYLLAVGTLHPRKNYVRLIEAFSRLDGNIGLVIAGKRGWLHDEVFGAVERAGLGDRIRLLDYVAAADLPALYAGARLLVMPSLYEGFGFPVLEAQACDTPVSCSKTSSLPEVAGNSAEYFDPLDVESMHGAIARVLGDPGHRQELIEKGKANISRFSWDRAAAQVLNLLR